MDNTTVAIDESRRIRRIALSIPIRVEGHLNPAIAWNEITRLQDVSAFGAGFNLKRPVKRGRLVQMTIQMPRTLRCYDYSEPHYKVWGIVRRCLPLKTELQKESYALGVGFIGKHPPLAYHEDPAKIFDIVQREDKGLWQITVTPTRSDESHLPKESRRHSRFQIPISLKLESLDSNYEILAEEQTVTENISISGASIFTTMKIEPGSFVRVNSDQFGVSMISIVRGTRVGKDNIRRLHVEFIDRYFPLEGIEQQ